MSHIAFGTKHEVDPFCRWWRGGCSTCLHIVVRISAVKYFGRIGKSRSYLFFISHGVGYPLPSIIRVGNDPYRKLTIDSRMELRTLFEAIKRLISTPGAVDGCLDPGKALTEQLKSNIAGYRDFLSLSRCIELSRRLEYHRSFGGEGHVFPKENEEDPTLATYNEFTTEALALVHVLDTLLCTLHEEDKATSNKTRPGEQPSPPSVLLSISENKTLRGMFEFVVALGIYPYLLPGVDTSVRLKFNRAESVSKAFHLSSASKNALLYLSCSGIAKCFKNEVIGASLLARHLSDVLIAMIQACYSLKPKPEDEKEKIPTRENCRQLLQNVLKETHQPLVVRELLVLQGMPSPGSGGKAGVISSRSPTPKWLRGACGKLLSERLMSKNGVQNVLNGIMEVTSGIASYLCYYLIPACFAVAF